jgi:hypothetical protein
VSAAKARGGESLDSKYLKPLLGDRYEEACQSGGGRLSIEKVIEYLGATRKEGVPEGDPPHFVEELALTMLRGTITSDNDIDASGRLQFLSGWIRFVTGDSRLFRMRWAALASSKTKEVSDRDAYALALWQRIVTDAGGEEGLIAYAERHWGPWDYYERHFFGWFLSRFDLFRAREMFGASRFASRFNWILLPITLGLAVFALHSGPDLERSFLALLAAALFLGGAKLALRLPGFAYLNSLIPRLAATVGIGYLFLINAPQIARFVCLAPRVHSLWLATFLLLLTALAYIMLHIARRVHPALRPKALLWRSLDLWALAVSYSALGLVAAAPELFSPTVLQASVTAQPRHLALVAAIALNLGVVLQLAWDEKPLTEPL